MFGLSSCGENSPSSIEVSESLEIILDDEITLCSSGEWIFGRGDKAGTLHQTCPIDLENPTLIAKLQLVRQSPDWAVPLNLNGDSSHEFLMPDSSGVSLVDQSGDVLWSHVIDGFDFIDAADVNENGHKEIILLKRGSNEIFVLEGNTGKIRYAIQIDTNEAIFSYNVHLGKYDKYSKGLQFIIVSNGNRSGSTQVSGTSEGAQINAYMFSLGQSLDQFERMWKVTVDESTELNSRFINWATSVVGDVTNNGSTELLALVYNGVVIVNIEQGQIEHVNLNLINQGRNYGSVQVIDLDNDLRNEVVIMSDLLSKHITTIRFSFINGFIVDELLWTRAFEASSKLHVPSKYSLNTFNDKNQVLQIISFWKPIDEVWITEIIDPLSGDTLASHQGIYVLATLDFDGDGFAEIIASEEDLPAPKKYSKIGIFKFSSAEIKELYALEHSALESRIGYPINEPIIYPNGLKSRSMDGRDPIVIDWDFDEKPEIFLRLKDNITSEVSWQIVGFDSAGINNKSKIETGFENDARMVAVFQENNTEPTAVIFPQAGSITLAQPNSKRILETSVEKSYPAKCMVSSLNSNTINEIICEDSDGIIIFEYGELGFEGRRLSTGKILAISKFHSDDINQILIWGSDIETSEVQLSLITPDGLNLWKKNIPQLVVSPIIPNPISSVLAGHFLDQNATDLFFSGSTRVNTGNDDGERSFMINTSNGDVIWFNDASDERLPIKSLGPSQFDDAIAFDINADGYDDLFFVSNIWIVVLDGRTGDLMSSPIEVMHALQSGTNVPYQWSGYSSLSAIDVNQDEEVELLINNTIGSWGILELDYYSSGVLFNGLWSSIPEINRASLTSLADVDTINGEDIVLTDGKIKIFDPLNGELKIAGNQLNDVDYIATVNKINGSKSIVVSVREDEIWMTDFSETVPSYRLIFSNEGDLSAPVVADVTGDGKSEILVISETGNLLIISDDTNAIN